MASFPIGYHFEDLCSCILNILVGLTLLRIHLIREWCKDFDCIIIAPFHQSLHALIIFYDEEEAAESGICVKCEAVVWYQLAFVAGVQILEQYLVAMVQILEHYVHQFLLPCKFYNSFCPWLSSQVAVEIPCLDCPQVSGDQRFVDHGLHELDLCLALYLLMWINKVLKDIIQMFHFHWNSW